MKANEFVKKHGWDAAKHKADELKIIESMGDKLSIEDNNLIRIVESWELVESSIDYKFNKSRALKILEIDDSKLTLIQIEFKRAINLMESCL